MAPPRIKNSRTVFGVAFLFLVAMTGLVAVTVWYASDRVLWIERVGQGDSEHDAIAGTVQRKAYRRFDI